MAAKKNEKAAMATAAELRDMSVEELRAKLAEQREELMTARFKHATAQLEKPSELKAMRRQVARISTVQALENRKGRTLTGIVVSDKNDKTIVVRVETLVKHPLLKKYVRRRKKFTAHDPMNECGMGDKVKIVEFRPMSRNKRWHLVSIIEKAV